MKCHHYSEVNYPIGHDVSTLVGTSQARRIEDKCHVLNFVMEENSVIQGILGRRF